MRFPISTKLVSLIGFLLISTVVSLVLISSRLFVQDNTVLIEKTNADLATSMTLRVRDTLEGVADKTRVLATILLQPSSHSEAFQRQFFRDDSDFLALFLFENQATGLGQFKSASISPSLARNDRNGEQTRNALLAQRGISFEQVAKGEGSALGIRLNDGTPCFAITLPFIESTEKSKFKYSLVAVVRQERFGKMFVRGDLQTAFLFDREGALLAHPDLESIGKREDSAHLEIVKEALKGKTSNGLTHYFDPMSSEMKIGAFRLVGFGGLGVVVEVPEAKAFEAAHRVQYQAVLVGFVILCFAFLIGYFFSDSIAWPLKQLVHASQKIRGGDFSVNIKPRTRDELADLGLAFNDMAVGLAERDRVKMVFNKFHNKEIVERLLSGEVKLGGERRKAVIFFSDIRGFTTLSESMTPEKVVEMLNEYMTRMVTIIRKHGGIVDKYVGDAIMALWGVPLTGPADARNALMACIEMRQELDRLNEVRKSRNEPFLYIGMGLNYGDVTAGNIGSEEKMEYTVIGDAVNIASRIESLTKTQGTDLLVADSIFDLLKNHFIFRPCEAITLRGKSGLTQVHEVLGYLDENGTSRLVQTPYSKYEPIGEHRSAF